MDDKRHLKNELFEWIIMIIIAIILAFVIRTFVVSTTLVSGPSMEPTLLTNDRLFVNRIGFMVNNLKKGDIVEFHNPNNSNEDFIKRVIGLPGDTIEIKDNHVYVNNNMLEEEYTSTHGFTEFFNDSYWEVYEGEIFVLGDNRPNSNDSRSFGKIDSESIVGIAFFRYFPFNRIGNLK